MNRVFAVGACGTLVFAVAFWAGVGCQKRKEAHTVPKLCDVSRRPDTAPRPAGLEDDASAGGNIVPDRIAPKPATDLVAKSDAKQAGGSEGLSPNEAESAFLIGKNHLEQKEYEEAVRHFTAALSAAPDQLGVLRARAEAYVGLKKYAEAEEDLWRATELVDDGERDPSDLARDLAKVLRLGAKQESKPGRRLFVVMAGPTREDFHGYSSVYYREMAEALTIARKLRNQPRSVFADVSVRILVGYIGEYALWALLRDSNKDDVMLIYFFGQVGRCSCATKRSGKWVRYADGRTRMGIKTDGDRMWKELVRRAIVHIARGKPGHVVLIANLREPMGVYYKGCYQETEPPVDLFDRDVTMLGDVPTLCTALRCSHVDGESYRPLPYARQGFGARVLDGLQGRANKNRDRRVDADELFDYVLTWNFGASGRDAVSVNKGNAVPANLPLLALEQ